MARTLFLCIVLIVLWAIPAGCMSVFHSPPQAHMLLRSRRANSFLEELKPASLERECIEELCDFEEAREIYQTREATLKFWMVYADGNQCIPNACENGVCVDQFQKYICICNPGYEGKRCHLVSSHTNCSMDNGGCDHNCHEINDKLGRYCSCINGYVLQEDSKQCVPKSQQSCGQILIAKSIYRSKPIIGLQPWIMGGEVGKRGESPWQALILNSKGKFQCGGVLLDEVWVLTAAHCLEGFSLFAVRLGDYKRFEFEGSEVTVSVVKTFPHPKYSRATMDNDIALLRLKLPVTFNMYIVPACLPSQDLAERVLHLNGTMTVVTGWGKKNEGTQLYSTDLKHINVPLMDQSECAPHMVNNLTNVLCASSIGSIENACQGDSGGPMMTLYRNTWFLIGLVSWGEGCGRTDKLGFYTKVSNYLEWIDSVRKQP
ncbi:vitamin K-dependent protein C-like [Tachysurus ichikawai]